MKNKQEILNSELIQVRDIIADKLTAAEAEIQKYTDMLQQEKSKADQAGAKIDADIDKADQTGYRKHIDEKKNAEEAQTLFLQKIEKLKAAPVIDKETYNSIADRIDRAMDAYIAEQIQEYGRTLEKLFELKQNISEVTARVNELHKTAQEDLYKELTGCYVENSSHQKVFVRQSYKERRYRNRDLLQALQEVCDIPFNYELLLATHNDEEITGRIKYPAWITGKAQEDASIKAAKGLI